MLSQGSTVNPLRHAMWLPDKSVFICVYPCPKKIGAFSDA
jgi:hypothetical protein